MKRAALLLLALAALSSAPAKADERAELLAGGCQFAPVGEGVWWQSGYQHELDMSSGCGLAAVSWIEQGRGWRLSFVNLGTARFRSVFAMRDEDAALVPDGSRCNPQTYALCVGQGAGSQTARGVGLGRVYEAELGRGVVGGLELGALLYEGSFAVDVEPHPGSNFARQDWMVMRWSGLELAPFAGASVRYGYFMAEARLYGRIKAREHGCGICSGVAGGLVPQVLVGVSFPL